MTKQNVLRRAHDGFNGVIHWVQNPLVILISICLSISSLVYTSVKNASQSEHLRTTFCGFLEPIAAQELPPTATEFGKRISTGSKNAVGADGLKCTPDRYDNQ